MTRNRRKMIGKTSDSLLCPLHSIQFSPLVFLPLCLKLLATDRLPRSVLFLRIKQYERNFGILSKNCGACFPSKSAWIWSSEKVLIFKDVLKQVKFVYSEKGTKKESFNFLWHYLFWNKSVIHIGPESMISGTISRVWPMFCILDMEMKEVTYGLVNSINVLKTLGSIIIGTF